MVEEVTKKKSGIKTILSVVSIVAVAAGLMLGVSLNNANKTKKELSTQLEANQAQVTALQTQLDANVISMSEYKAQMDALGLNLADLTKQTEADKQIIADYAAEIEKLKLEASNDPTTTPTETIVLYSSDEEALNFAGDIEVDAKDLSKLGDYEISFDGNDIDVEDTLVFSGALASNENKFDGTSMYMLSEGDIEYKVSFSEDMTSLDYDEDELSFKFLGENVIVSDWTSGSVNFDSVSEQIMKVGDVVEGVTLLKVGDDSVVISYNNKIEVINHEQTKDLGPIDFELVSVFNSETDAEDLIVVQISKDLDTTVEDGDEYEPDDRYEWSITDSSIGLVLVEDFDEYDTALVEGQTFSLPDDFVKLGFELSTEDMYDVSVSPILGGYEVKGQFEDYKKVFTDGTLFYEDNEMTDVITDVEFSNSNRELRIGDLALDYSSYISDDNDVYKYEDEAVSDATPYAGTVISNLDEDDLSYDVSIPDEDITVIFNLE